MVKNYQMNLIENTNLDIIELPLVTQGRKLDADEYWAEDLDGGTESVFGSGNIAYAILQASQLDASGLPENTPVFDAGDIFFDSTNSDNFSFINNTDILLDDSSSFKQNSNPQSFTNSVVRNNSSELNVTSGNELSGNFAAITVGSIGASELSSNFANFSTGTGLSLGEGLNGIEGNAGQAGQDGQTGQPGDSSSPGDNVIVNLETIVNNIVNLEINVENVEVIHEVLNSVDNLITYLTITTSNLTTILNSTLSNVTNLENITNIVEIITNNFHKTLDTTLIEVSSLIEQILDITNSITTGLINTLDLHNLLSLIDYKLNELGDIKYALNETLFKITEKVESLGITNGEVIDTLHNLINDVTNLVDDVTGNLTETLNNLPQLINNNGGNLISNLVDPIIQENLDLVDTLTGESITDITQTVDTIVDQTTNLADNLINQIMGNADPYNSDEGHVSIIADPVIDHATDIIDALTGGAVEDSLEIVDNITDVVTDIADNLLQNILTGNSSKENNTDTDLDFTGAIDVIDIPVIEAVIDVALNNVEDLVGDVDANLDIGANLFNNDGVSNHSGDNDLTLSLNNDLIDHDLLDIELDIELDGLENLVGDIDLNLDLSLDIFSGQADPVIDNENGGTGENTLFANVGNLVEGILDGLNVDSALSLLDNASDNNPLSDLVENGWTESIGNIDNLIGTDTNNECGGSLSLPDPLGIIAEGIGALGINSDLSLHNLGGLFG